MTSARTRALAALAGTVGLAGAAALAQRRLLEAIREDPEYERLRRPLEGERMAVHGADGTELHVEAFGPRDAPKLLLVHGWICTWEFWRYQIEDLAGEFRVIAYDQRGHGQSAAAGSAGYRFDAFADDFGAVLDRCVPEDERAVVVGHSMGAMTAAAWAGRHDAAVRHRLAGVVLVNTGLGDLITEAVVLRTPRRLHGLREPLGRLLMGAELPLPASPSPVGDAAVRFVTMSPAASPARVAFCRRMVLSANPAVRGACGRAMARMDLWSALESLEVPTVVIAGELDKLTPPPLARRLADALPDLVDLVELPDVGHMAPLEAPEAVTEQIRALARRESSDRSKPRGGRGAIVPQAHA